MQTSGYDVDNEFVRETWHPVYRRYFLRRSLAKAYECRKSYYAYHQGLQEELGVREGGRGWERRQCRAVLRLPPGAEDDVL